MMKKTMKWIIIHTKQTELDQMEQCQGGSR